MSGHKHNPSAGTQNQGNTLGDRSCVRQSKLYRMYESGNGVKAILGSSNLCWDPNQQQGAYSGQKVFDHNALDGYRSGNTDGGQSLRGFVNSSYDRYSTTAANAAPFEIGQPASLRQHQQYAQQSRAQGNDENYASMNKYRRDSYQGAEGGSDSVYPLNKMSGRSDSTYQTARNNYDANPQALTHYQQQPGQRSYGHANRQPHDDEPYGATSSSAYGMHSSSSNSNSHYGGHASQGYSHSAALAHNNQAFQASNYGYNGNNNRQSAREVKSTRPW